MPLSPSFSSHLSSSSLSSSLYLPLPARLIVNVAATETRHHRPTNRPKLPISLRPTPSSASHPCHRSKWLLMDIGYLIGKPMELADPPLLPTLLADVVLVCNWWFFILFVISDFVWSGLRKKIGDLVFFIFFYWLPIVDCWYWWWLWVGMADGRCGCSWCCVCFLNSVIYYFIVLVILFYCDVYIILLYWKLK